MKPNIVYILADDMGYGDLGTNNPDSKIPTPNLDRLAAEGIRFSNAHAGSSVCTPSRYAVLTGRYSWRGRLKSGIVWEWDGSLIEPDRPTVGHLLQNAGYATACFGKWHLGWDWATKDGTHPNETLAFGEQLRTDRAAFAENIDFSARIGGGPVDRGFDSYFGVDVPNFSQYTWFIDDHVAAVPTTAKPDTIYGNEGPAVPGWSHEPMIPEFTRRACEYIRSQAASGTPFFVYYPLTSPHSPVVPNDQFKGRSGAGNYGDFVCEVDWVVGEVMGALEEAGVADNTLLIFTSDNGPEKNVGDDIGAFERIREYEHYSMGTFRGVKRDVWEGGHRVPFVTRWPAISPAGGVCDQLVSLSDLFATCAEIVGASADVEARDSVSMLPLLRGDLGRPTREFAIHHSAAGTFAIRARLPDRDGDWVLIDGPSGGDLPEPDWYREQRGFSDHSEPRELYELKNDQLERVNLYRREPEVTEALLSLLDEVRAN
jgi:arylsulfatase A-like enzyme